MADSNNLGNLYYTLDLDDKEFERKMKEKADKYGVSLTIKAKVEGLDTTKYFQTVEKASSSASRSIKDDMERNIPALMKMDDRLKQLNKWYAELEKTSEAAGRAQLRSTEASLRAAEKLTAEQRKQQGKQQQGIFTESVQSIGKTTEVMKQMSAYYKEMEQSNEKALKASEKLTAEQRKQQGIKIGGQFKEYIASLSKSSDVLKQMSSYYKDLEKETAKAAKDAQKLAQAQEKANQKSAIAAQKQATIDSQKQMEAYRRTLMQAKNVQIDFDQILERSAKSQNKFSNAVGLSNKTLLSQRMLAIQVSNQIGTMFSIYAAERFIKKLAEVRGEFEMQQVSLRAILQDAQAADHIFNQVKQLAVVSPFEFKDLVGYTKQLSAFSVPVEELYDTMKSLADISSGLGVDMGRIILAYGQVRSASVLRGQELRQFTEAGIPLVDELAKKFAELRGGVDATGKAIKAIPAGEVFDLISRRAVPFEMVKEVFEDLTSEGGKFYKMQEKQAESLKGKIANLADAYDIMLNQIGEANDGILKGGVEAISSMMNNWKELSKVLLALVATYGTFKAVMIATNTVMSITKSIQMVVWVANLTTAMNGATKATTALNLAQKALISTPIGLFATGLAAVVGALILFKKEAESTADIIEKLNAATSTYVDSNKELNGLIDTYESLSSKTELTDKEQDKLNKTMSLISQIVPGATSSMNEYGKVLAININHVKDFAESQKKYNKLVLEDTIESGKKRLAEIEKEQKRLVKIIETGTMPYVTNGVTMNIRVNEEGIRRAQDGLAKLTNEATEIAYQLAASEETLNGIKKTSNDPELYDWAKNLNEQISKLDISQSIIDEQSIKKAETTFEEFKKNLVSTYKDAQAEFERRKQAPEIFSDTDIANYKKKAQDYKKILDLIGGEDIKQKKGEDPAADALKKRIDLTKEAYKEYEKLRKLYSDPVAMKMVEDQEGFKGIDISKTKNELVKNLQSIYSEGATLTSEKGKKVLESLMKDIRTMIVGGVTDDFDQAMSIISKKIEEQKGKYDFYHDVLGLTGDKTIAFQIAFEGGEEKFDTYIEYLKNEFEKVAQLSGLKETSFDQIIGLSDVDKSKLPDQVKTLMEKIQTEISNNKVKVTIDAQGVINQFASIQDKIALIEKKAEQERAEARAVLSPEMYTAYEDASFQKQSEEIAKLKGEMLQLLPVWQQIFGETKYKSYGELEKAAEKAQEIIKNATINYDSKTNKPLSFSSIFTDENGKEINVSGQISLLEKLRKQIESLGEAGVDKDPFKSLVNGLKNILSNAEGVNKEAPSFNEKLSKMGASAAASANMIGSFASNLSDMFDALGNEGMANALSNVAEGMQSIANIGEAFAKGGVIGGIAAAAGEAVKWITKIFQAHDKKLQKQIEDSEKRVKRLGYAYADLERTIEKSLGQEKYDHTDEQLKNLAQQQKELYKQADLEEDKKKSDSDKVEDLRRQAVEVGQEIENLMNDIIDDITGGAAEIAKTLGDAFFEAFASGEDAAKAWADTVKDLVADIARQKLIEKYLEPAIDKILDKNTKGWFNDKGNIDISKVVNAMPELRKELMELYGGWAEMIEALSPELKDLVQGSAAGEGAAKTIKGITEDTAQLLASLINAIRQDVSVNRATLERIATLIGASSSNASLIQANVALIQSDVRAIKTAFLGMISGGHPKGGDGLRVFIQ